MQTTEPSQPVFEPVSYWHRTAPQLAFLTDLPASVEMLVVGGGLFGAATAYWLARAGHEVALLERVGAAVDNVTPLAKSTGEVLSNTNKILVDLRPKVSEMAEEAVGIAKSGREGVERVGEFLRDAGDRAHTRLEQIDRTVENTVGQVDQVGEVVKRAVMAPVREVNGLAAGISAAVSTLVSRPRRPSVDEATQDEEMFI